MSFVIAAPEYVAAAATDLANIGSTIGSANAMALAPTSSVMAAGGDEVSALISMLFSAHAQAYQALSAQAASFHDQFVQLMNAGGSEYALTEAANASPMQAVQQGVLGAMNAPSQALTGSPPMSTGATVTPPVGNVGLAGVTAIGANGGAEATPVVGNTGGAGVRGGLLVSNGGVTTVAQRAGLGSVAPEEVVASNSGLAPANSALPGLLGKGGAGGPGGKLSGGGISSAGQSKALLSASD